MTKTWKSHTKDPRRLRTMNVRREMEKTLRTYFERHGYLEVQTPLLVPSPGMEPHIRPFQVKDEAYFLPTSPEFAMKKLLVGGLSKIYQLAPAFRNEPASSTHLPEFTMLEFYERGTDLQSLMIRVEDLICNLARIVRPRTSIDLSPPWPQFKVKDLFQAHAEIDLTQTLSSADWREHLRRLSIPEPSAEAAEKMTWDDYYFLVWLNRIENKLPLTRPCFVTHYPASQAALAETTQDDSGYTWAERFELYAGGLELANAFHELKDPEEHVRRYEREMAHRKAVYGESFPSTPFDEEFLAALREGLPVSSGIALGWNRLVMLFAGESEIQFTRWL